MPVDEALAIARQIAESLEAAHEQGIVHRDLKPANVKVREDGTVKARDFGLAKALELNPRRARFGPVDDALADDHDAGNDAGWLHPGIRSLHESRAGSRQSGRLAGGHLGLRLRALRDAHRQARVRCRRCVADARQECSSATSI